MHQVEAPELVCPFPQCSDEWIWALWGEIKKKKIYKRNPLLAAQSPHEAAPGAEGSMP